MKILFVVPRYHLNLYYRVKALQDAGHEVFMIVTGQARAECYDNLTPTVLKISKWNKLFVKLDENTKNFSFVIPNFKDLKNQIKKIKPEVLVLRNINSIRAIMALFYARKFSPIVFTNIQTDSYSASNKLKRMLILILKKIFKVKHVISPLKNVSKKHDPWFQYIPFVIEVKDFEKKYFKNDRINIVSIGKFIERKEHLLLIRAVSKLKNKYNLFLTIVGMIPIGMAPKSKDYFKEAENYIKENNLENMVEIKPDLAHEKILELLRESDLYVLPSYNEPAAYSILEAMAAKLPVIVSDDCGTKCYIDEDRNGYIFKMKNENDLAQKIEKIISDRENIERMGEAGFKKAKEEHKLSVYSDRFNELIAKGSK